MKNEQTVYELLELIGEAFMIEILENDNIRDDVFDILEGSITTDLVRVLEKIKRFRDIASR